MKKQIIPILLISLISLSQTAFASFSDVSQDFHLYQSINWLEKQGVVVGYSDGTFRPENDVTRAEFLKMLYETTGMENHNPTLPFPDVPLDIWYTKYIKEAYKTGIVVGYDDGNFRPDNPINFSEALKIVTMAFFDTEALYGDGIEYNTCHGISLDNYPSIDTSEWYWQYIHIAEELCIISFDSSANLWEIKDDILALADFNPNNNVSRADMAALLYRAKTIKDHDLEKYNSNLAPYDVTTHLSQ